jgi:hypothetical protein
LSYSSTDAPRVLKLAERLRAAGLTVWLDKHEIKAGDQFVASLEQGLQNSRKVVLCLSPAALQSDWVTLELIG